MKKHPTLKNPPIIEAVIGINVDCFSDDAIIKSLYESTSLKELYPNTKETKRVLFQLNPTGHNIAQGVEGYVCESEDEQLFLEKSRITLVDRNKYETFERLLAKYKIIWEQVSLFAAKYNLPLTASNIGLRYKNAFKLPLNEQEYLSYFSIAPQIELSTKKKNFASIGEFASVFKLNSTTSNATAAIQVVYQIINDNQIEVIFDIETNMDISSQINFEVIKNTLYILKDFKNDIFFANVPKAKEIFS